MRFSINPGPTEFMGFRSVAPGSRASVTTLVTRFEVENLRPDVLTVDARKSPNEEQNQTRGCEHRTQPTIIYNSRNIHPVSSSCQPLTAVFEHFCRGEG